jgi:diaminopimelate decarboxylase
MKISELLKKPVDFSFFPSLIMNRHRITKIIKKNPSPFFLTSTKVISNRLQLLNKAIKKSWGHNYNIAYSFKTNYDIANNFKFNNAEVVSSSELALARNNRYQDQSIIINGPNKGNLFPLLQSQLMFNIDNFPELHQVVSSSKTASATIGLRVNCTYHPSRFGFNIDNGEAQEAITILKNNHLPLKGIHFHCGSDVQKPDTYFQCTSKIAEFVDNHQLQTQLEYVDLGGGIPSHGYLPGSTIQSRPNLDKYIEAITAPIKSIYQKKYPLLIFEPGRFLVDDATMFVTKIIDIKRPRSNLQIITTDSTINMLPSTWYRPNIIQVFHLSKNKSPHKSIESIIYGSSCQENDVLYSGTIDELNPNDFLVFFCVGAYNQSQSSDFIFKKPPTHFLEHET